MAVGSRQRGVGRKKDGLLIAVEAPGFYQIAVLEGKHERFLWSRESGSDGIWRFSQNFGNFVGWFGILIKSHPIQRTKNPPILSGCDNF
jgi:hypothetical protein